ncbi:glycosyltransferase [Candidatus Parcubacteria bacterium]|nr:MAG: glycosyltransferase [Candidatus Parcubacteria bacterium]
MRICYFGTYDPVYTRNRLMIQGLKENGVEIIECRVKQTRHRLKKYLELVNLHRKIKKNGNYDIMVVGFAGHAIMPLAWILAGLNGKKVILDLFVSEYDSVILDRKAYSKYSLQALKFWAMDRLACVLADLCLLDADEHINYFAGFFKIKKSKFKTILLSVDQNIFYPEERTDETKFVVHYHGSYSPIQGVKYIVKAAELLKNHTDIIFNIIGKESNHQKEINMSRELRLKNINFLGYMTYEKLADTIRNSDVVLGMFGDTEKALHCSAYKIIEGFACRKPVVTGDTPALREIVKDKENGLFCRMADPRDLADKIMVLKNDPDLRNKIAESGYQFCQKYLTPKATAGNLLSVINQMLK